MWVHGRFATRMNEKDICNASISQLIIAYSYFIATALSSQKNRGKSKILPACRDDVIENEILPFQIYSFDFFTSSSTLSLICFSTVSV